MNAKELIKALESYGFRSDGGPLENCLEWINLRDDLVRNYDREGTVEDKGPAQTRPPTYQVEDGWIEVRSGKMFFFENPTSDMIDIEDIAASLSKICRYKGHTVQFYSVAEHSVLLARWARRNLVCDANSLLGVLLDDAGEAYGFAGDMPKPIKVKLPDYVHHEGIINAAVARRFGVPYPKPAWISEIDARILRDEREQAMSRSGNNWGTDALEPLGVELHFWGPDEAEDNFLGDFHELWSKDHKMTTINEP